MFRRNSIKTVAILLLLFFVSDSHVLAQMTSGNFEIPVDSVDVGGGASNSSNYGLIDSVGETASGNSNSSSYELNAGFLAAQTVYLAITAGSDVSMSPSISGVSGGTGTGSTSWIVTTDNAAGYTLNIHATTSPALRSASSSFDDYTPAGSNPDYNWSVASTDSEFGFSPEGADIIQKFKDDGSSCNTGVLDSVNHCWAAMSTSDQMIAQRTSGNHPSGTNITVKMQAESGSSHIQPNGAYSATFIVTAIPL